MTMGLVTPHKIQALQRKLYLKAKQVHKHRLGTRGECRYPADYMYETMGLANPCVLLKLRKPSG